MEEEEEIEYEDRFEEFDIAQIKRGYFGESKHSKNIARPSNKNKVRRNAPRQESHFLSIKKAAIKLELRVEQKARSQHNFWKNQPITAVQPQGPSATSLAPSPQSSSSARPRPAPVIFEAPKSQYERDLQTALKASNSDKHASGLSMQNLLDLSSRELTPEDYEMLLLLDSVIEKKTTSASVLEALNETVADETTVGDCPICVCSFEAGDKLKHLNCSHVFHVDCVTEWLTKHSRTCPLCNATVTC